MNQYLSTLCKAALCLSAALILAAPVYASSERGEYYEHGEGRHEYGERSREEIKFYGTIEALPQSGIDGTWRVSGREVLVTPRTLIKEEDGRVAVGVQVEVKGTGTPLTAYEIEVKSGTHR